MTRVERADDFDEHATSKRPLARGIRANDAGLRAMRSVPSSSRRRATTTNRRLLNAARTAITHVGKRLKKKVENCKKNVTQKNGSKNLWTGSTRKEKKRLKKIPKCFFCLFDVPKVP